MAIYHINIYRSHVNYLDDNVLFHKANYSDILDSKVVVRNWSVQWILHSGVLNHFYVEIESNKSTNHYVDGVFVVIVSNVYSKVLINKDNIIHNVNIDKNGPNNVHFVNQNGIVLRKVKNISQREHVILNGVDNVNTNHCLIPVFFHKKNSYVVGNFDVHFGSNNVNYFVLDNVNLSDSNDDNNDFFFVYFFLTNLNVIQNFHFRL